MKKQRTVIFGAGGFGREIIGIAEALVAKSIHIEDRIVELVFAVDHPELSEIAGIPVIPAQDLVESDQVVIALGDPGDRRSISKRLKVFFTSIIAPTAIIGKGVAMSEGVILCDHVTLTGFSRIGKHFHANIYSYVAHDCIIGDYVTFAPRVSCNGNVHVHDGVYIGTGAVLKQGSADKPLIIGEGAIVGMGAVVTKDVAPGSVVIGNPAAPLKPK